VEVIPAPDELTVETEISHLELRNSLWVNPLRVIQQHLAAEIIESGYTPTEIFQWDDPSKCYIHLGMRGKIEWR